MLTLKALLSDIAVILKYKYNSASDTNIPSERLALMKRKINYALSLMFEALPAPANIVWRSILVEGKYTTGTVDVTQGSRTVTGTLTVWKKSFARRQFKKNGDKYVYEIEAVDETNNKLTLVDPYMGEDDTDADYTIASWQWPLPYLFSPPIHQVFMDSGRRELDVLTPEEFGNQSYTTGTPSSVTVRMLDRAQEEGAGTLALTEGSTTVTGTSTAFTDKDVGKILLVDGYATPYLIESVASATSITVSPSWQDSDASGKTYQFEHSPAFCMEFDSAPSSDMELRISYGYRPPPVYDDSQRIPLPPNMEFLFVAMCKVLVVPDFSQDQFQLAQIANEYRLASQFANMDPLGKGYNPFAVTPTRGSQRRNYYDILRLGDTV